MAKELVFGDISTGAQDGLQRTTDLVRHMIARDGVSEALGLATFDEPRQALCLQVPDGRQREYSEATGRLIDEALRKMMEAPHARAQTTLGSKRGVLEALAKLLIEKEVVNRDAFSSCRVRRLPRSEGDAAHPGQRSRWRPDGPRE